MKKLVMLSIIFMLQIHSSASMNSEESTKAHYGTVLDVKKYPKNFHKIALNYIYAPIEHGWYSVSAVKKGLPKHYDLVLIDWPTGAIGRGGFLTNLSLFDTNVILIFDDVNKSAEAQLMKNVAKALKRKFGVILPK